MAARPLEVVGVLLLCAGCLERAIAVAALEPAGLVTRSPDPSDRRAVLVRLTGCEEELDEQSLRAVIAADGTLLNHCRSNRSEASPFDQGQFEFDDAASSRVAQSRSPCRLAGEVLFRAGSRSPVCLWQTAAPLANIVANQFETPARRPGCGVKPAAIRAARPAVLNSGTTLSPASLYTGWGRSMSKEKRARTFLPPRPPQVLPPDADLAAIGKAVEASINVATQVMKPE